MIRYIPPFILQNHESGLFQGSFPGFVLMLDIAHFSKLTRDLNRKGHYGAEELGMVLNASLGHAVKLIHAHGGILAFFAGDAICAVFPKELGANVMATVSLLANYYAKPLPQYNPSPGIRLQVRQVVSFGTVNWEILNNPVQNEYLFFGDPLNELSQLFAAKASILFSPAAVKQIGAEYFTHTKHGYGLISGTYKAETPPQNYRHGKSSWEHFVRRDLRLLNPENEIRSAAICFLKLDPDNSISRQEAVALLETMAYRYGAFVNKLMPVENSVVMMLVFGAPQSKGKTLDRVAKFALEAVAKIPTISIGVACGVMYAGSTCECEMAEYTVYGEPVNVASRLMDKAEAGEILCDATLYLELHSHFRMQSMGKLMSSGIAKDTAYYRLYQPLNTRLDFRENSFVDRFEEMDILGKILQDAINNDENAIIYVSGDPGIGKTRIAKELSSEFQDQAKLYRINCEEILRNPLDGIKQLVYQEFSFDPLAFNPMETDAFREAWQVFAKDNVQMLLQESVIAALINLEWPDSTWSMLPPEARRMHMERAIQDFLQQLCSVSPVLIHLDDGQWLDEESCKALQNFSATGKGKMIIVSACRYLKDGTKVDLKLAHHRRFDLELGSLNSKGSFDLIQEIVGINSLPLETLLQVQAQAMGNPLFIEQICYYLLEHKLLSSSGLIIGAGNGLNTFRISDIIGSRIDGLEEKFLKCLLCAAVLGVEFNCSVLAHMLGENIAGYLGEGIRLRLWKDAGNNIYAFTHVLIRDVAYQRLMGTKLRKFHQLAGEAFQNVFSDTTSMFAEEIGMHYQAAGMLQEAAKFYDQAGDYYEAACLHSRSERNFHKALNLLEQDSGTETPQYSETLFHLGLLYHYLLEYPTAEQIYLQVLKFQEEYRGKDNPALSPYINNLGRLYKDMGRFEESKLLLNKSLQIEIHNMPTSSNVADRMNNIGHLYTKMNDPAKALPYYQQAVELMGANYSNHPYYGGFINNLAMTYMELGELGTAALLVQKALGYTLKAYGNKHPASAILIASEAKLQVLQKKYKAAEKNYQQAFAIFNDVFGVTHQRTQMVCEALSELYTLMGKPKLARSYQNLLAKRN